MKTLKVPSLLCAAVLLIAPAAMAEDQSAAQNGAITSAYTKIPNGAPCVVIATDELGGSSSCPGYGGYGVLVTDGDARISVFYGYVGEWYAEGAFESFSTFNSVNDTIEWRLHDEVPRAAILRWLIDHETATPDKDSRGEILVVSKVAQPGEGESCVIGYVDARDNDDANEIAREVADTLVDTFRCRLDDPEYHGTEGLLTDTPVRSFGP